MSSNILLSGNFKLLSNKNLRRKRYLHTVQFNKAFVIKNFSDSVVKKAKKILGQLEMGGQKQKNKEVLTQKPVETTEMPMQFNMFDGPKNEIIDELKNISLEVLTPIEAMNKLFELKNKAEKLN